jgi:Flp pilus assembly protein TadG
VCSRSGFEEPHLLRLPIRPALRAIANAIEAFGRDCRGTTAVTFAVMVVPVTAMIGMSLDLVAVQTSVSTARNAADAAALAALAPQADTVADRTAIARKAFDGNITAEQRANVEHFAVTHRIVNGEEVVTVDYRLRQSLSFAGMLGRSNWDYSGQTEAARAHTDFLDVRFWLDGSASMGIAADEAGRDRLIQLSSNDREHRNCAFACHMETDMNRRDNRAYGTTYERAEANGVTLRIDLMKQHVGRVINELEAARLNQTVRNFRYGIASIDRGYREVLTPNNNLTTVQSAVSNFSFSSGWSGTFIDRGIAEGEDVVPEQGFGSGNNDRRTMIVMVTDGYQFNWDHSTAGWIAGTACETLKRRGIPIAIVHLRYVEINHGAYNTWVRPYIHLTGPALQRCASEGMYFSADSPAEIERAFSAVRVSIHERLRITK